MKGDRFSGGGGVVMWYPTVTKSEARLNRNILNNSVKRKAMEDLYEIPRKLIHKELQS